MPRESKRARIQRMHEEYALLVEAFPHPKCALDFTSPLQLLIATVLSAQTTDKRVNTVTPELFSRFPDAASLAAANPQDVEDIIHPLGFYRSKTKHLLGLAVVLRDRFGGEVPDTMDSLVTLPGVGRKTANVVLGNAFGVPGFPVDTHVIRVTGRLRWRGDWNSSSPDLDQADGPGRYPTHQGSPVDPFTPGITLGAMQHSARHTSISSSAKSAIIFVIVAGVLGCAVWLGWSLLHRRYTLPTFSGLQSSVKVSVGITGAPESLDIRTTDDDSLDRVLLGNVYETLLKRDDNNKIQPSLASSWKVSEDGTTYRFNLRSGATFADGTTITSSDAVWSLQQIITKKYVGSDELSALSNVESDGNSTLVLRLREPDPRLLAKLTTRIGIVYNQRENIDYAKQASGSGPFTVSQWQSGKQLTLSRNDHYWGSKSKAKTVTVNFAADTTELAKALNNGQIDAAVALDQSAADAVKDDGIVKKQGVSNRKVVLAFSNNTQSILSDKRFRQAARYLIDKNAMTEALGGGTVMTGPLSPLDDGYQKTDEAFGHDIGKGNDLIKYFRFRVSRRPLTFVYPKEYGSQIGEQVKQTMYAEPAYSDVSVSMVDDATWSKTVTQDRQYDFTIYETDGEDDLDLLMDSNSYIGFVSTDSQNAWSKALKSFSSDDYAKNFQSFIGTLDDDSPVDWICTRKPISAYRSNITGVPVNMTYTQLPLADMTTTD